MKEVHSGAEFPSRTLVAVNIGVTVRRAREAAGYSRQDLAITCGLTVGEIVDIEEGEDTYPPRLERVARALKISLFS